MASHKNSKIRRMLLRKGFKEVNTDHKMLIFHHRGKKTAVHTKVSHGSELPRSSRAGLPASSIILASQ